MLRSVHQLACVLLLVSCSKEPKQLTYTITETRAHDRLCYTQGLEFAGGKLFESGGQYAQSSIREVDPKSGKVLRSRAFPAQVFAEGITILNGELFVLTWLENTAFVLDPDSFKLIRTHKYEGEGWGLTNNGKELIMSDGSSSLQFRDPRTFEVKRSLTVTDGNREIIKLNELEFTDGVIFANIYEKETVAKIDATTGTVTGWLDLSGLRPKLEKPNVAEQLNGIVLIPDTNRFLITGKYWPSMFVIEIGE